MAEAKLERPPCSLSVYAHSLHTKHTELQFQCPSSGGTPVPECRPGTPQDYPSKKKNPRQHYKNRGTTLKHLASRYAGSWASKRARGMRPLKLYWPPRTGTTNLLKEEYQWPPRQTRPPPLVVPST